MSEGCRACGKPLVWALSPAGKRSPIEAEPDERGNVLLLAPIALDGEYLAVVLSGDLLARVRQRANVALRLNHFAYCPHREEFRPGGARRRTAA